MSVYVGPLFSTTKGLKWPYGGACHMFADTVAELHELAEKIGLQRKWFQGDSTMPHYDLTRNKRGQAVAAGAIEADHRKEVEYIRKYRTEGLVASS